jgi:hypothetical protein
MFSCIFYEVLVYSPGVCIPKVEDHYARQYKEVVAVYVNKW